MTGGLFRRNFYVLPQHKRQHAAAVAGLKQRAEPIPTHALYDGYLSGFTASMYALHEKWAPLTRLCQQAGIGLGFPFRVNMYMTPPGSQGFTAHSDCHDIFVLQLHGRKRWTVYEARVFMIAYAPPAKYGRASAWG